jgi:hypothetical protein
MAAVSRIPLVFIDSNVLYPVRVADLVLSSADDGLFEVCVSENLLVEIERVLIEVKGLAPEKAKVFTQAVASNSAQVVRTLSTSNLHPCSMDPTLMIFFTSPQRWKLVAMLC